MTARQFPLRFRLTEQAEKSVLKGDVLKMHGV